MLTNRNKRTILFENIKKTDFHNTGLEFAIEINDSRL